MIMSFFKRWSQIFGGPLGLQYLPGQAEVPGPWKYNWWASSSTFMLNGPKNKTDLINKFMSRSVFIQLQLPLIAAGGKAQKFRLPMSKGVSSLGRELWESAIMLKSKSSNINDYLAGYPNNVTTWQLFQATGGWKLSHADLQNIDWSVIEPRCLENILLQELNITFLLYAMTGLFMLHQPLSLPNLSASGQHSEQHLSVWKNGHNKSGNLS